MRCEYRKLASRKLDAFVSRCLVCEGWKRGEWDKESGV